MENSEASTPKAWKPAKKAKYECSCRNFQRSKDCPFSGHCVEPLAWSLSSHTAVIQDKCPLFAAIPRELRDMIWEFALINCRSNFPEQACNIIPWPNTWARQHPLKPPKFVGPLGPSDIAVDLLQTCKAVYLETFTLPLSVNTFSFNDLNLHVQRTRFLPWQLALIQKLRLTLQQIGLEGKFFTEYFGDDGIWGAHARQKNSYVVPFEWPVHFKNHKYMQTVANCTESFNYLLVSGPADSSASPILEISQLPTAGYCCIPPPSKLRVALARPFTHLTIRLEPDHWWTWSAVPYTSELNDQLALDPWVGNGNHDCHDRPTSGQMKWLADERRAGRNPIDPTHRSSWGRTIGRLPGLKTLELVLETFAEKKHQLETVVECSKTWSFPIEGVPYALVWDGKTDTKTRIQAEPSPDARSNYAWYGKSLTFEVRTVRFVRKRMESVSSPLTYISSRTN